MKLDYSYNKNHRKGNLPEFYMEDKLRRQREKEEENRKKEEERLYHENK